MKKFCRMTARVTAHSFAAACLSLIAIGALGNATYAKVTRIEIIKRADWLGGRSLGSAGAYEMIAGRAFYAVDPRDVANKGIVDLERASRNANGGVEFSGDFLILRPKDPARSRGSVLFEVANRGHTQIDGSFFRLPSGQSLDLLNASAVSRLDDAFVFDQGFTLVWAGWQFDVPEGSGPRLNVPTADVNGDVRASFVAKVGEKASVFPLKQNGGYCAADLGQSTAVLTVRARIDGPATIVPRKSWAFAREESGTAVPDPCYVRTSKAFEPKQLYEVVYRAKGSPVAGLGFAAVRDFVAYLKHGEPGGVLREAAGTYATVFGFGYSQAARFLRDLIYQGFNADERGRRVFDGLFVAGAGAGRGDFNNRFSIPGVAGNSVLAILRPVDLFPFTDLPAEDSITRTRDGLLVRAERQRVLPKIFYTYSSTEYWARVGSLAHTSVDGSRDFPLHPNTRLYFIAGTPHALGRFPPRQSEKDQSFAYLTNPASKAFAFRALLLRLEAWVRRDVEPPPSAYPQLRSGELVSRRAVRFPKLPGIDFPGYMPRNWRMDYGFGIGRTGVSDSARPTLGQPYTVFLPQVDQDGNESSGVRLPHLAVPLGTYAGWNYTKPRYDDLDYLAGLIGSFIPFPRTPEERIATGDPRPSILERYGTREGYLQRVHAAAETLVQQRYVRKEDVEEIERQASQLWDYVMQAPAAKSKSQSAND